MNATVVRELMGPRKRSAARPHAQAAGHADGVHDKEDGQ